MKRLLTLFSLICLPLALLAQVALPSADKSSGPGQATASAKEWAALLSARQLAEQNDDPAVTDVTARAKSRALRITRSKSTADLARAFYTAHPADALAGEARKLEVFSLIQATEEGDGTGGVRLDKAVAALRADPQVSVTSRAQAAAAYDFTRALHGIGNMAERKSATERVARQLMQEFPAEPQAYEALLAVARASAPEKTGQLAREIAGSSAPDEFKRFAQLLLDRDALVGHSLASVLGDDAAALSLPANTPVIVYSWATWGPGSLGLGRMIQARRFAAIGVCLDDNLTDARQAEHAAGLGGKHIYDAQGRTGKLATRLAFSTAGQIYLVDAAGVIRDVRGGEDLETKLKALDFSTPALVVPPTSELLRQ